MIRDWPYQPDLTPHFGAIADLPWAVFLDSGRHAGRVAPTDRATRSVPRYQLISALPDTTLVYRNGHTTITSGNQRTADSADPFDVLRRTLRQRRPRSLPESPVPFVGGAIGWFGYELGAEQLGIAGHPRTLPDMAIGIYRWALLMDHWARRGYLVGAPPADAAACLDPATETDITDDLGFKADGEITADPGYDQYRAAFERVQRYLRDGDCYQVNLARRFEARVNGDPWQAYRLLRRRSPAPYGAYLSTPDGQVLCNSPEQFLGVDAAGHVVTRPIKGTRPRSADPEADRRLASALASSVKDRAENVMIVDLMRNDLGRVCRPGSITVEALCALEDFATVRHLVSCISGRLTAGRDALDLLRSALPGGSITGAPKHRAIQIIHELEPHARGVYCGSIGYLDWRGRMDSNIAIRTMVHQRGLVHFHAGGGIVTDSQLDQEYRETLDKAAAMLELLGGSSAWTGSAR